MKDLRAERKKNQFVIDLEKKANEIYQSTNEGGFTGKLKLYKSNIGNEVHLHTTYPPTSKLLPKFMFHYP